MSLASMQVRVARALTRSRFLGESLVYYFADPALAPKIIQCSVDRGPPQDQEPGQAISRRVQLLVPRDSESGVTAVTDGDEVGVTLRLQDPIETRCRVMIVPQEDEGAFHLDAVE